MQFALILCSFAGVKCPNTFFASHLLLTWIIKLVNLVINKLEVSQYSNQINPSKPTEGLR